MDRAKTTARQDEKHLSFGIWWTYIKDLTVGLIFPKVFSVRQGLNLTAVASILEAMMAASDPSRQAVPIPMLRMTVGNNSAAYTCNVANAAAITNFPVIADTVHEVAVAATIRINDIKFRLKWIKLR